METATAENLPQEVKEVPNVHKKKEASMNVRLAAKLKELDKRGLLTKAKAYVCPNDPKH